LKTRVFALWRAGFAKTESRNRDLKTRVFALWRTVREDRIQTCLNLPQLSAQMQTKGAGDAHDAEMPSAGDCDAGVDDDERGENHPCVVMGENEHAALSAQGLGDSLLALFDKLVRAGGALDIVRPLVDDVLEDARLHADVEMLKNLFVLAFQTRWCRGGKAERMLFYTLLQILYARFPSAVLGLLRLIPKYGYWKDLLSLLVRCPLGAPTLGTPTDVDYSPLHAEVWSLFAQQLDSDWTELQRARAENRTPQLSLCAKYAPSEGGQHSKAMQADKKICEVMFYNAKAGDDVSWLHVSARYRRLLTQLRRELGVVETFMCAKRWAEIEFGSVPSLCMDRQKRAFLNEKKTGGVAHPDDASRAACREKLLAHIVDKGVSALKGKQLFPHELVQQVINAKGGTPSLGVSAVLDVQWAAVRNGLLAQVEDRRLELARTAAAVERADALELGAAVCPGFTALSIARDVAISAAISGGAAKPVGLARVVPMADVSGSMSGTPMLVSIALGILASEVTHESFRDKVLTFHERPSWHDLSGETSFVQKALKLAKADWGCSTDFYAAMQLIADVVREKKLGAGEIPDLLVVSDMQFNEAVGHSAKGYSAWSLAHHGIKRIFSDLGLELHGRPFDPPQIIFWNVRADTVGYPAAADDRGVMMLSGFSPALLKFVLSGEMEQEVIVGVDAAGNAVKEKQQICPREALRRVLYDSGLDAVRAALDAMPVAAFLCA
jgi:hypothetical protein